MCGYSIGIVPELMGNIDVVKYERCFAPIFVLLRFLSLIRTFGLHSKGGLSGQKSCLANLVILMPSVIDLSFEWESLFA